MTDDTPRAEHRLHWLLDALHTERRPRGRPLGVGEERVHELRRQLWRRVRAGELRVSAVVSTLVAQLDTWLAEAASAPRVPRAAVRRRSPACAVQSDGRTLRLAPHVARLSLPAFQPAWSLTKMPTPCGYRDGAVAGRKRRAASRPQAREASPSGSQRCGGRSLLSASGVRVAEGVYDLPTVRVSLSHKLGAPPRPTISNHADVESHFRRYIGDADREYMLTALLDSRDRLMALSVVAIGSMVHVGVRVADVYRPLILAGAVSYYIAHNHPSGDATPSREDVRLTQRLHEVGALLGIELRDHLVLGAHGVYASLREQGLGMPQYPPRPCRGGVD